MSSSSGTGLGLERYLRECVSLVGSPDGLGQQGPETTQGITTAVFASPSSTASLLATSTHCLDAGVLPSSEGIPTGALVASKRKFMSTVVGSNPGGVTSDLSTASEAFELAVRV